MITYSKKIFRFIEEIKSNIRNIISLEIGLKLTSNGFFNLSRDTIYPLKVVIYNNQSILGYFDPNFYELGFHEKLMHAPLADLRNIIRHELAHYIAFMHYGSSIQTHGPEFRAFCQKLGWGEQVYRATTSLDESLPQQEESSVLRKVKKLMALSTSSNQNEAEQALIKSQQLLLRHHIDAKGIVSEQEEQMFLKRLLKEGRLSSKMRAIARILSTFFVNVIFNRGQDGTYLEIVGSGVNVEIAEYVAHLLHTELDRLWQQAKKLHAHMTGTVARNSFFLGVAKGYCEKVGALQKQCSQEMGRALMVLENQLVEMKELVYPKLSSCRSSASYCHSSSAIGEQIGRQLQINPAVDRSKTGAGALIGWSA